MLLPFGVWKTKTWRQDTSAEHSSYAYRLVLYCLVREQTRPGVLQKNTCVKKEGAGVLVLPITNVYEDYSGLVYGMNVKSNGWGCCEVLILRQHSEVRLLLTGEMHLKGLHV